MTLRRRFVVLGLLAAVGCSGKAPPDTGIIVYVDSDLGSSIDRVKVTATTLAGAAMFEYTFLLGNGADRVSLPVRAGLFPLDDGASPIRIEAQGLLINTSVVSRSATLSFLPGKKVVLNLSLLSACKDQHCPTGETCFAHGACYSDGVKAEGLPTYAERDSRRAAASRGWRGRRLRPGRHCYCFPRWRGRGIARLARCRD